VVHDEPRDLEQRSLIDLAAGIGGIESYDALATARGRRFAEKLQARRADKRQRKIACRDAMVDWLYARDATGPLTQPARSDMLADPRGGIWLAAPFEADDLDAAAAWLNRHRLVGGMMVDECEGPVRLYLTDAGIRCAEEFDSDTTRFIAAQRPGGTGVGINRSAGAQVGSRNVQVNHFYSNPTWPADGRSPESGSPPRSGRASKPALTVPGGQVSGSGNSHELAGTAHDFDTLYLHAVDQLGSGQEPVRIGALHALSRLGQSNPGLRRTVIDVICAYLRMPCSGPNESPASDPAVRASWRKELQVRLTAQSIVADHLRDDPYRGRRGDGPVPEAFWPEIDLVDLRGAYLMELNLSGCRVRAIECNDAVFAGESLFRGLLCDLAFFQKAVFKGLADFRGSVFTNDTWFSWATFAADAWFHGDKFFPAVHFGGHAGFREAAFDHKARFEQAIFDGSADFEAIACKVGTSAVNLDGCRVRRPDAVNPDASMAPSIWPPGWDIEPGRDGIATLARRN
jgi:hypothetical protein